MGGGLSSIGSAIGGAVSSVGSAVGGAVDTVKDVATFGLYDDIGEAVSNVSDSEWWSKAATSGLSSLTDPRSLAAFGLGDTSLTLLSAGDKANETWNLLSDAEKAKSQAEVEQAQAKYDEDQATKRQEKMTSDRAKEAAAVAKERATRLGQGRRGLLYQATNEKGVGSDVLGG